MKQRLFLIAAILFCVVATNAQRERKNKIEDDGFEWYQIVIDHKKWGAEDKYGNTIIPTIHTSGGYATSCAIYETHKYFWVCDWDQATDKTSYGIYNRKGKCIIPVSRGYSWIEKSEHDELPIGTYYLCWHGNKVCSLCDVNGQEMCTVRLGMPTNERPNHKFYLFPVFKDNVFYILVQTETGYGIANGYGKIIVNPTHEYIILLNGNFVTINKSTQKKEILASTADLRTTRNLFANNPIEDPYADTQPSVAGSGQTGGTSSGGTTTVIVEQHGPVQVWVPCGGCQLSPGRCSYCNGSGWGYNNRLCSRCNGTGKCTICNGTGGHNEVQYR